ncbi:MAG TPA: hypothetical protein PKD85_08690 [Saprospiraceae bacterium]|nr:hypothetical protein [Saprospiraceae bacterium]
MGGDSHSNHPLSYYFSVGEEKPFCSHVLTGVGRIYPDKKNPIDTVFLNNGNPIFSSGWTSISRYEVKNNDLWDEQYGSKEDSLSRNYYLVIQGFNSDTSIIWGAFQLKLVGGTKSTDVIVNDGKFRVQVTKKGFY